MVVLEPVPLSPEETSQPKPKPSTPAAADEGDTSVLGSSDDKKAAASAYDADGFETASETEVDDDDFDAGDNNETKQQQQQQPQEQNQKPSSVAPKDQSFVDALNDEEFQQKILTQMNDAKVEGNKLFGDGKYEEALLKYDSALQLAPEMPSSAEIRSLCHANRATCFFKLGKYEDTVKESGKALELNPTYMKVLHRRAEAQEKLENYDEAIADLKKIVELDPSNYQAKRTIIRLEPLAVEKREKLKEEMLGKLKDMGNSILGRFGMSVDNFKAVKDPNTGSYSISFQR